MRAIGAILALGVLVGACGTISGVLGRDGEQHSPAAAPLVAMDTPLPAFAFPPLSPPAILAHVEELASDGYVGRAPAEDGEEQTLAYLEAAFYQAGLQPGVREADGTMGWRQLTPLVSATVEGAPRMTIASATEAQDYAYRSEQVIWTKRLEPHISLVGAPLVFVGYGVVAPELGWNDYAGIDMTGKIAVILINDPDFETGDDRGFGGRAMTYYGRWTYKFEEAARQGAAGALIIHETAPAAYPWPVVMSSWTGPQLDTVRGPDAPQRVQVEGWISASMASSLFTRAGLDFGALKTRAQSRGAPPVEMGLAATVSLDTVISSSQSYNVVGILPGRARPDEAVLYTAHWDHLGRCTPVDGDDICNGAQDNATGTAGLIEIARRHVAAGRPERSVVFVAFTAEEQGLLGSIYYANHPIVPAAQTVAAINMDGLNVFGATHDVTITGFGKSDLDALLTREAATQNRRVEPEPFPERGGFYRSDHFPLANVGIPVLYARSGLDMVIGGRERGEALSNQYVAERYHKPNDEVTPDWDLTGASQDLQLFYHVGRDLASGTLWPEWSATAEFRARREASLAGR
jgi:Zn-dependent M28 family amino/carboxypeptidase